MRDLIWKQGREAGITVTSGSGIACFYGDGMRESQGELSGIREFKFLRDHVNTESWQKRTYCAYSSARSQVMNGNGPVNVSIITWLHHEFVCSLSPIAIICDIIHISPLPTISKLSSVILTPRSFLVFLIFRPFPGRLAYFGRYGYTGCSPRVGSH